MKADVGQQGEGELPPKLKRTHRIHFKRKKRRTRVHCDPDRDQDKESKCGTCLQTLVPVIGVTTILLEKILEIILKARSSK